MNGGSAQDNWVLELRPTPRILRNTEEHTTMDNVQKSSNPESHNIVRTLLTLHRGSMFLQNIGTPVQDQHHNPKATKRIFILSNETKISYNIQLRIPELLDFPHYPEF
jgi:hypothetical protein